MPELEKRILEWRRQMAAGGVNAPEVLDELESHLREDIGRRLSAGASEPEAFQWATARIGSAGSLRPEFNKVSGTICLPVMIGIAVWFMAIILMVIFLSARFAAGRVGPLLFAHIFSLTSGYLAAFAAGGFGIVYVCWRWSGRLSPPREQSLSGAVFRFTYISGGLVLGGFLLGTLWSRQHLGAYGEDSPRWIGCVCACSWVIALCLIQRFGRMSDHVRMLLSIVGNVIVGLAWFFAIVPGVSLKGIASYWSMEVFFGAHLLFLLMGFSRKIQTVKS